MHGYGLHFLLNPAQRNNAGHMAFSKPLVMETNEADYGLIKDINDIQKIEDPWYYIESLKPQDRFFILFYKKFGPQIFKLSK